MLRFGNLVHPTLFLKIEVCSSHNSLHKKILSNLKNFNRVRYDRIGAKLEFE